MKRDIQPVFAIRSTNGIFKTVVPDHRRCFLILAVILVFANGAASGSSANPRTPAPSAAYQEALNVADTFLWYWVSRKADDAIALLQPRLSTTVSDRSWFRLYVNGLSNPHHQAFEIWGGQGSANHYIFQVTLYEIATGQAMGDAFTSTIELVKFGNAWRVDRLPKSADNQE